MFIKLILIIFLSIFANHIATVGAQERLDTSRYMMCEGNKHMSLPRAPPGRSHFSCPSLFSSHDYYLSFLFRASLASSCLLLTLTTPITICQYWYLWQQSNFGIQFRKKDMSGPNNDKCKEKKIYSVKLLWNVFSSSLDLVLLKIKIQIDKTVSTANVGTKRENQKWIYFGKKKGKRTLLYLWLTWEQKEILGCILSWLHHCFDHNHPTTPFRSVF